MTRLSRWAGPTLLAGLMATAVPSEMKAQAGSSPYTVGVRVTIASRHLGGSRDVLVSVPDRPPDRGQRYPVIYVLDGQWNFLQAVSASRFLAANGLMPQSIVVGVLNSDRDAEFTPPLLRTTAPPPGMASFGKADRFLAFVGDDLLPMIDRTYPTQPLRVLVGHSLGGLFADYVLTTRHNLFAGYITLELSLWWDDGSMVEQVGKFFRANPAYAGRLIMAEATSPEGWKNSWNEVKGVAPKSLRWSLIDIPNESHETMVFSGTYQAMRVLFADYPPRMWNDESASTLVAVERQYDVELSRDYGYPVRIPEAVLLEASRRSTDRGDHGGARLLLDRLVTLYPSDRNRARLAQAPGQPPSSSRPGSAVKRAVTQVSLQEAKPFLGVWAGELRTEPGTPAQIVMTFAPEKGEVRGSMLVKGIAMNGGDLRMEVTAIRIRGDTIEWDRRERNGGTHVHIGQLKNQSTLEGRVELRDGGPLPEGFTPPVVSFTLRRETAP